jgi:DNA helicase-2/ATP-dependent DNA helicase PcrA
VIRVVEKWEECHGVGKALDKNAMQRALLKAIGKEAAIAPDTVARCRRTLVKSLKCPTFEGRFIGARRVYQKLLSSTGRLTKEIKFELAQWNTICQQVGDLNEFQRRVAKLRQQEPITTSTIHGAKGREWDRVFVVGMVDGAIPDYRSIKRGETEEERRLLYVAITRAKERVYLFDGPWHRPIGKVYDQPSRFMTDELRRKMKILDRVTP